MVRFSNFDRNLVSSFSVSKNKTEPSWYGKFKGGGAVEADAPCLDRERFEDRPDMLGERLLEFGKENRRDLAFEY